MLCGKATSKEMMQTISLTDFPCCCHVEKWCVSPGWWATSFDQMLQIQKLHNRSIMWMNIVFKNYERIMRGWIQFYRLRVRNDCYQLIADDSCWWWGRERSFLLCWELSRFIYHTFYVVNTKKVEPVQSSTSMVLQTVQVLTRTTSGTTREHPIQNPRIPVIYDNNIITAGWLAPHTFGAHPSFPSTSLCKIV